jgi:hypothetical protein
MYYNAKFRSVCIATVAVGKQQILHILSVCFGLISSINSA